MTEKEILKRLKETVDQAPINVLDELRQRPVEKMAAHDDITRQVRKGSALKRLIPFTVASAAMIGLIFQWQSQYVWADSQVYYDINPSIVVTTNKMEQVIRMEGINPDAAQIVQGIEYRGKSLEEVTGELMDQLLEKKYLTQTEKYILLSVYNRREGVAREQKQKLDQLIHQHLQGKQIKPVVLVQEIQSLDEEILDELDDSEGKATLIRKLIEQAPKLQPGVLKDMSVHDLVKMAKALNVDLHQLFESQDFDEIDDDDLYDDDDDDNDDNDDDDNDDNDDDDDDDNDDDDNDHNDDDDDDDNED